MKLSEIGKLSGFDPKDIEEIRITGRHYKRIRLRGGEAMNWGELDFGVEIFIRPNEMSIWFKQGYGKTIYTHWLGLDGVRFINDEEYANDLKKNW